MVRAVLLCELGVVFDVAFPVAPAGTAIRIAETVNLVTLLLKPKQKPSVERSASTIFREAVDEALAERATCPRPDYQHHLPLGCRSAS
jgi:hypothetical protein